jgi:imidazolonepropionase-like amidohydrolase
VIPVWLAAAGLLRPLAPQSEQETIAIQAGGLIDGTGRPIRRNVTIVITGERIREIRAGRVVPTGARVIDLSRLTVLPGFIDAHTHLTFPPMAEPGWKTLLGTPDTAAWVARARTNARLMLEAGFTTVREVGALCLADKTVRDEIAAGRTVGPRMLVGTYAINGPKTASDSARGYQPGRCAGEPGVGRAIEEAMATDSASIVTAVREAVRDGADVIKIYATGDVLSTRSTVDDVTFPLNAFAAAVRTARSLGRRITAHGHGTAGIKAAVRAGVTSIEHGSNLDDETARLMAKRGTFLVPTLMVGADIVAQARSGVLPEPIRSKALGNEPRVARSFQRALRAGVKIALGTDNIFSPHGTQAREFVLLGRAGLSPMQAIQAGTKVAAEMLGLADEIGTVAPGRFADLVAVEGDPLEDLARLQRVAFVMKAGRVVKQPR